MPRFERVRFVDIDPDESLLDSDIEFVELIKRELLETLYRWQILVLRRLRQGYDVMIKAATGAGKSMVFQSMMFSRKDGIVLVVAPTLAIMNDQVPEADISLLKNIVDENGGTEYSGDCTHS